MVMRNPSLVQSETLRRRMFRNPAVYNRNDPVGIMGSSPQLMQAVMNNRPKLPAMDTGNPFIDQGLVRRLKTQFIPDESDPQGGAGGQTLPPPVTRTLDTGTGGGPRQQSERSTIVPGPKTRPEGLGPKKKKDDDNNDPIVTAQELSNDPYKVVEKLLGGKKSIDDLVKKNKRLLDEYAPLAKKPDEKRRAFTDFFLRMAERGAEGDDLLAAAAKSARPAVEGFTARKDAAEAKQEQRDMVALTLGMEEKKTQDAALQEAALKLLEDKDPSTLKIAKALQAEAAAKGKTLSLSDAIQATYRKTMPGFQAKAYDDIMSEYPQADPVDVAMLLSQAFNFGDLALGIGDVEDVQAAIDKVKRILEGMLGNRSVEGGGTGTVLE